MYHDKIIRLISFFILGIVILNFLSYLITGKGIYPNLLGLVIICYFCVQIIIAHIMYKKYLRGQLK